MSTFSVEADGRRDALDLQRQLLAFSPWMVELSRGSWVVHGSLGPGSLEDVRALVEHWARERGRPLPVLLETDLDVSAVDR
jgi:hypothetical protein